MDFFIFKPGKITDASYNRCVTKIQQIKKITYILFLLYCVSILPLCAQSSRNAGSISFDFLNQSINDILYSLSSYHKIPIVGDDTVNGNTSFQYVGSDFEKAFSTFLSMNRLYVIKNPEVWTVTRIQISIDENKLITLDSFDVNPSQMLDRLSSRTRSTIVQDILPNNKLSIHIDAVPLVEAVELIMKSYSDYTVVKFEKYIQIKKNPTQGINSIPTASGTVLIKETGGLFDVTVEKTKLTEILEILFNLGKCEFSSFVRGDQILEKLRFTGKKFSDSLDLILEQTNAEYAEINGIWYIFPIQQTEIIRKLKDDGKSWKKFDLQYISFKDFQPLLQVRFPTVHPNPFPSGSGFLASITDDTAIQLLNFIKIIDTKAQSEPIRLKYIKTEDLFKSLPPSVTKENIIDTGNGNTIFFLGTLEKKEIFFKELEIIDRPRTRVRYDLLIIQFQETSNMKWGFNVNARQLQPGDMSMITGALGSLLTLNFDVITVFGYQFATKMNLALCENQANVFADTTLYGLSGQEIQFQNTNTYRYRDSNIDPETSKPVYTGITREIISGLLLNINGWVSGDGMITSTVTASVSKRGADVSSTIGNPPPTSEKVITTQVRSRSGEPVVLSGLRQNDSTIVEERLPFISRIPLIGWLFKNKNTSKENTQMVIYLVPHIDLGSDEYTDAGLKTASIYNRLVVPFLEKNE